MVKYFGFLILTGLLLLSCNKIKKMESDIIYNNFYPHLILNPADSTAQLFQNCTEFIPYPSDSTQWIEIDINNDDIKDFRFTYSSYYQFVSETDSCKNHNSKIEISALGIGKSILVLDKETKKVKSFDADQKVNASAPTTNHATIYLDDHSAPEQIPFSDKSKYIGVQLSNGCYGWIKVLHNKDLFSFSIMGKAYQNNIHMDLIAGQKE